MWAAGRDNTHMSSWDRSPSWPRFLRWLTLASLAIGGSLYAFILVIDPYQNVPFSPALQRVPVSTNQRYAFPALARSPGFDSAIVGTSTLRLLDPARMGRLLDSPFVNLAMNSATAYEQTRIHALFMRARAHVDYLVVGIDDAWCRRQSEYAKYTFRGFPEWMYDDDPWNDLRYLFNDKALENAVRMLEYLRGKREAKYRLDGYRDLSKDFGVYDLEAVRDRLYKRAARAIPAASLEPRLAHADWHYATHTLLDEILRATPAETQIAVVFPPMHGFHVSRGAVNYAECKGRIAQEVAGYANVGMIDYMFLSALTTNDENYWDPLHFVSDVARVMERDLVSFFTRGAVVSEHARVYKVAGQARAQTSLSDNLQP